jgi:hypothetical protein
MFANGAQSLAADTTKLSLSPLRKKRTISPVHACSCNKEFQQSGDPSSNFKRVERFEIEANGLALALQQSKLLHAKKATKRKSLRSEAILKVILERERERERYLIRKWRLQSDL